MLFKLLLPCFSIRFLFLIFISYFLLLTMTQIHVYLSVYHEISLLLLRVLDGGHCMSLSFVLHFPSYHLQQTFCILLNVLLSRQLTQLVGARGFVVV